MSQRHRIVEHGSASNGEVHAQGVVAPGLVAQVSATEIGVLEAPTPGLNEELPPLEVPHGPDGGPLQGSSLTGAIPIDFVPPVSLPPPQLSSIDPATAEVGGADLTLTATGVNFVEGSVILFNNSANETTFVSSTELTTLVEPSTASGPWTVPVGVRNPDGQEGGSVDFVFTDPPLFERPPQVDPDPDPLVPPTGTGETPPDPAPEPAEPAAPEPDSPSVTPLPTQLGIVSIHRAGDKLVILVDDPSRFLPGMIIKIEATGSTAVNGEYPVESIDGNEISVVSDYDLANPIEGKGRILFPSSS